MNKKPDINDLIEQDMDPDNFYKGGQGSGQKGHVTPTLKDYHKENQMKEAASSGRLDQLRGVHSHFREAYKKTIQHEKTSGKAHPDKEYYKAKANEASNHLMNRLGKSEDINDLIEYEMDPDNFYKGGVGSGQRGHRGQPMPGSGALLEKIRAARAKHSAEQHPEKKAKHAAEVNQHVEAYEKLNPHLADPRDAKIAENDKIIDANNKKMGRGKYSPGT